MAQFTRQHLSDGRAEVADARTLEIGLPAVTGPISPYFHGCSMDKTIKNGGLVSVKHPETGIIEPIYANILNSPIQFLGPHLFDHMEALQSNLALQASYAKRGKKQFINRSSNYM